MEGDAVDNAQHHRAHQAADGPLHRLLGRQVGGELVFAQEHACNHGRRVRHEGQGDGQKDIAQPHLVLHHADADHGGQAIGDHKGKEKARAHPVDLHPEAAGKGLGKDQNQVDQQSRQGGVPALPGVHPEGDDNGQDGGVQGDAGVVHADGVEGLIGAHRRQHRNEGGGKGLGQQEQHHQDQRHPDARHKDTFFHRKDLPFSVVSGPQMPPKRRWRRWKSAMAWFRTWGLKSGQSTSVK